MAKIDKINGRKIEFVLREDHIGTIRGLILKHFQRRPVDAQIYFVAVGNDIYHIHEKLSHGVTVKTQIEKVTTDIDLTYLYRILVNDFDYYQVS